MGTMDRVLSQELRTGERADSVGPPQRAAGLARLRRTSPHEPLDVLVIGGGVVGCGAALDAAARGLSVALVEAGDFAVGTSSRSSRLAHGGLRYLEQREFGLVREALTERGLLLDRLAPHLVRPVPFLLPVTNSVERSYLGAGVQLYDMLSRIGAYGGSMPRPRTLSRSAVHGLAPGLRVGALGGAVRFHDAQIDDARHTVALARSASGLGASLVTGLRVVGLLHGSPEASSDAGPAARPVVGARVREDGGDEFEVHARVVLSATGVWTDDLLAMATGTGPAAVTVRRSKGVHLVVPRSVFRSTSAVIARTPSSVLFLLPWSEHWLVGTTDTDDAGDRVSPQVEAQDVAYLIGQANRWLERPLVGEDVVGVYAGLRPLLSAGVGHTTELSREHAVLTPVPGFVAIAGGKYTTYRVMAADAIDAVADQLPADVPPTRTDELPLVGADRFRAVWAGRVRLARAAGLPVPALERLLRRHGDRIGDVLELLAADPALGRPLHPQGRVLRAEAVIAARDEGARSLSDILIRRTRLAVQTRDRASACAADAAALVAPILGWDATESRRQAERLIADQPGVPELATP